MDTLHVWSGLLGAVLRNEQNETRTIVAVWLEKGGTAARPIFVALTVSQDGTSFLKISLPDLTGDLPSWRLWRYGNEK